MEAFPVKNCFLVDVAVGKVNNIVYEYYTYEIKSGDAEVYDLYFIRKNRTGNKWAPAIHLAEKKPYAENGRIAAVDGLIVLVFQSKDLVTRAVSYFILRSDDNGKTFGEPTVTTEEPNV